MEDTGPKSRCVNCALLVDSVDEDDMEKMASVTTFLVPGIFFLGIAIRSCTKLQSPDHTNIYKIRFGPIHFTCHKLREKETRRAAVKSRSHVRTLSNIWDVWPMPTLLRRITCWWWNWWQDVVGGTEFGYTQHTCCNCNIWVMFGRWAQLQLRRLIIPCCANWWLWIAKAPVWARYIISTPVT